MTSTYLNWTGGLIAAMLLAAAGVVLLRLTRDHRDTQPFQRRLFLVTFGARLSVAVAIYARALGTEQLTD